MDKFSRDTHDLQMAEHKMIDRSLLHSDISRNPFDWTNTALSGEKAKDNSLKQNQQVSIFVIKTAQWFAHTYICILKIKQQPQKLLSWKDPW